MTKPAAAPIPPSLRRAGIASVRHEIPEGTFVTFGPDFVRIFRAELEEKLYGWRKPAPAITRHPPQAKK